MEWKQREVHLLNELQKLIDKGEAAGLMSGHGAPSM